MAQAHESDVARDCECFGHGGIRILRHMRLFRTRRPATFLGRRLARQHKLGPSAHFLMLSIPEPHPMAGGQSRPEEIGPDLTEPTSNMMTLIGGQTE